MNKKQKKRLNKIILSAIVFIVGLILNRLPIKYMNYVADIFLVISYIVVVKDTVLRAVKNIRNKDFFDENFLMSVATIGAFLLGDYAEAVVVMLFYEIGELFQGLAVEKSRKSISDLMDIRPDYANLVKEDGSIEVVDPYDVEVDSLIKVKPGEKVPLDSIVVEGTALFDTSALTGESVPRKAKVGDRVLSGFINTNSIVSLRVEKEFYDSTASKIIDMVENASAKKSKSEAFITKFSRIYSPIVVILAILIAIIPPFFIGFSSFHIWAYRALSFLVVSCPCALVVSVPLSFFAGIGAASGMGVLVKGSNYLEALANTEYVVFDKTGTLTKGVFELTKIDCYGVSEEEALKLAAYAEIYSSHPIAISLKNAFFERNKEYIFEEDRVKDLLDISGHGISISIDEKTVLLGNDKLMQKYNIDFVKDNITGTVVYLAREGKLLARFIIADKIKEDAAVAISGLKSLGIKKTVMLTGDNKETALEVAGNLGIDECAYELLPGDKVEKVENLLEEKDKSAKLVFVGDGINDAPVLARADVGVAMGGLGSDAAIEAADIVIMSDEPSGLNKIIALAKRTISIANQNIVFAIGIKVLVLILTAFGISGMWAAVFADVGVTIIAVINSMRNLSKKI